MNQFTLRLHNEKTRQEYIEYCRQNTFNKMPMIMAIQALTGLMYLA